jgi:hypothetical protein
MLDYGIPPFIQEEFTGKCFDDSVFQHWLFKRSSRENGLIIPDRLLLNEWLIFDNGIITACCRELFLGGSFWKM